MAILHLTSETFDREIGTGASLVDFWADWCGPCRMLAPIIEDLAQQYASKASFCKVDVDACGDLAERYGVANIPTVILFRDGAETKRFIGVQPKTVFEEALAGI
ncbi:MAG: thioredoxin [Oscillospiraceae bacterium]|jgi:thioredoxin 1|nr:thioredoxin [Oscillospiraceae bacterium]